jgi:hypothetical protein
MNDCTTYAPLLTARAGELSAGEESGLHAHLAGCDACQARLADGRALDGLVAEGLSRAAARRDFSEFATQVMARLPVGAWRPDPADRGAPSAEPLGALGRLRAWTRHHRLAAVASALVPALAAAAIYLLVGGNGPDTGEPGVDVTSETYEAMVLETSDGPLILLGESSDGT